MGGGTAAGAVAGRKDSPAGATSTTATTRASTPHPRICLQGMPPALNILFNLTNAPQINATHGMIPGPIDLMVMYTKDMAVAINYYEQGSGPEQEETSCYDLSPTGGDYNVEFGTPTQLNNLSPWANAIRKSIGVPEAGTAEQQAACVELLQSLRWAGAGADAMCAWAKQWGVWAAHAAGLGGCGS